MFTHIQKFGVETRCCFWSIHLHYKSWNFQKNLFSLITVWKHVFIHEVNSISHRVYTGAEVCVFVWNSSVFGLDVAPGISRELKVMWQVRRTLSGLGNDKSLVLERLHYGLLPSQGLAVVVVVLEVMSNRSCLNSHSVLWRRKAVTFTCPAVLVCVFVCVLLKSIHLHFLLGWNILSLFSLFTHCCLKSHRNWSVCCGAVEFEHASYIVVISFTF